jgi:purine-nucleoside phosphorylase
VTEEAKRYIQGHTGASPSIGLVLGSGLGAFADELTERTDIPYADIPGWPHSTAVGHAGKLIVGKLGELNVAVMAGRAHAYEGYAMHQVTYGVRVLQSIGVRSMVFTNAAGRHQSDAGARRAGADQRPHQSAGNESASGPNDDCAGSALPRHVGSVLADYRATAKQVAASFAFR